MTATEAMRNLEDGVAILQGVLGPHGFTVSSPATGTGSGGTWACSQFRRGNRTLRLHFRYSLGLVEYEVAGVRLSHEDYMRSVTGLRGATSYPGFSNDPLDGFRHLAADPTQYAHDFLSGTDEQFVAHAQHAANLKQRTPRLPA
jgi:hypothetical protein